MDRRSFLAELGVMAAAGSAVLGSGGAAGAASAAAAPMPLISVGKHRLSRLVAGSNPLNGNSYLGPHMDRHMREYFTVERTIEFLQACERAGINTHQYSMSNSGKSEATIRQLRDGGSKLQFICLASKREDIPGIVAATQPIAVVHHGGVTDKLFGEGKGGQVHDFVKAAHDNGVLAGVSAHNPNCIQQIADEGWEVDLFMTCFYFLTRKTVQPGGDAPLPETLPVGHYAFYRNDPLAMTRVVRQVKQPCLGFKILAAGRLCANQTEVRSAFQFAFANIKPTDGVIVGMYPQFFDEVNANAQYTRDLGRV